LFPDVKYYAEGAKQGYLFLKNVLWDKEFGGFYIYTDKQGNVKKSSFAPKEAYGNAFALYALAAYYHQSGDTSALNLARREFAWLEQHSHDPVYKGYFQHMERDGTPIKRPAGISPRAELGYKDQNTSIHLLEAFTELYQVWPDALLRTRLQEMLDLLMTKIITPKGNLQLFFETDWTPVSNRDSTKAAILKYKSIDHVSFGHDVETAYLMLEATHALGIKDDKPVLTLGKKMLDHALDNGWDNNVGGFYDEGYYFKDKQGITILADTKNWWAQAEGLNTLLLMSDYYPKDQHRYYQKFTQLWAYVQTYLIDQEHGDWYQGGIDKQPQYKTALKGQIWKGTYHNLRALINCVNRLQRDTKTQHTNK
jgi:mannobiose 2-epimerase